MSKDEILEQNLGRILREGRDALTAERIEESCLRFVRRVENPSTAPSKSHVSKGFALVAAAVLLGFSAWLALEPVSRAGGRSAPPSARAADETWETLFRLARPQPGESKWATVPWLTNLGDARRRAALEDKPLFLWRSGGGDVLGRT